MRFLLGLMAMLVLFATSARAESPSPGDEAAFRAVITAQIDAFRVDDGARAYSYAAPDLQRIFSNPDVFMNMVRQNYQPVYRPRSYRFGDAGLSASGRPIQRVTVEGPDGITYEAIYTMERQADGTWRIIGCALVRAPDISA